MEKFGLSAVQMGSYLAVGNAMHIPAGFLWAALESVLLRRNVPLLTIRKGLTGVAAAAESVLAVLYGLAPNPLLATMYCESRLESPLASVRLLSAR